MTTPYGECIERMCEQELVPTERIPVETHAGFFVQASAPARITLVLRIDTRLSYAFSPLVKSREILDGLVACVVLGMANVLFGGGAMARVESAQRWRPIRSNKGSTCLSP